MSRRKGETTAAMINETHIHQVSIPGELCQASYPVILDTLRSLPSSAARSQWDRIADKDFVRFAFGDPDDADKFFDRFGGHRLIAERISGRRRYRVVRSAL